MSRRSSPERDESNRYTRHRPLHRRVSFSCVSTSSASHPVILCWDRSRVAAFLCLTFSLTIRVLYITDTTFTGPLKLLYDRELSILGKPMALDIPSLGRTGAHVA